MHYHIPNACIKNINIDHRTGDINVFAEAMPLQERYEVAFQFNNPDPSLWDMLFGYGTRPRTGITICTDLEPPSLIDLRWAYLAAKVRYEMAALLAELEDVDRLYG